MNSRKPLSRTRKTVIGVLKFAVPVLVIGWLLGQVETAQWEELRAQDTNLGVLALALGVAMVALAISYCRWWLLVRCQGISLSLVEALRLGCIGFLLSFVSVGSVGGDLFKALFLARRCPGKRLEAVASVLVDRASGLLGLLLIVSIALFFTTSTTDVEGRQILQQIGQGSVVLVGIGTVVLAVLILGGRPIDRLVTSLGHVGWLGKAVQRITRPLRAFHDHPWGFLGSLIMSLAVHGLFSVSIWLIAWGLYPTNPTVPELGEHLVIVPVGLLASALPLAPAGLGVFEAAIEAMYKMVPAVPTDISGTMIALVFELVKVVLAVFGVLFYWTASRDVRRLARSDPQAVVVEKPRPAGEAV